MIRYQSGPYAHQGTGVGHGRLGLDLLHEGGLELLGGVGSGGGAGAAAEEGRHDGQVWRRCR